MKRFVIIQDLNTSLNKRQIYWIFSVIGLAGFFHYLGLWLAGEGLLQESSYFTITMLVMGIIMCAGVVCRKSTGDSQISIFIITIVGIRLAFHTWIYLHGMQGDPALTYEDSDGAVSDPVLYDRMARDIVANPFDWSNLFDGSRLNSIGITNYAALIYKIFGLNPYNVILFNSLIVGGVCFFTFRIATVLFDRRVGLVAAVLFSFLPESLIYGSLLTKEIIVAALFVMGSWGLILWWKERYGIGTFYLLSAILLLLVFRDGFVIPLLGSWVALWFFKLKPSTQIFWTMIFLGGSPFLFQVDLSGLGLSWGSISEMLNGFQGDTSNLSFSGSEQNSLAMALGANLSLKNIYFLPIKMVLPFLSPFPPWQYTTSFGSNMILLSQWFVLAILPAGCWSLWKNWNNASNGIHVIVMPLLLGCTAIAFSGPFINDRYRFSVMPLVTIFCSHGLVHLDETKVAYKWGIIALSFGTVIYYSFKLLH